VYDFLIEVMRPRECRNHSLRRLPLSLSKPNQEAKTMMPEKQLESIGHVLDHLETLMAFRGLFDLCVMELERGDKVLHPHLICLLGWMKAEIETISDDGSYHARQVMEFLEGRQPARESEVMTE
jgi:hypothetical protein